MNAANPLADDQDAVLALISLAHSDIIAQIENLKSLAEEHEVEFSGPVTEEEISNFERQRGCVLPINYRCFLLLLGNILDEPYTFLKSLPTAADILADEPSRLLVNFPLVTDWSTCNNWEEDQENQDVNTLWQGIEESDNILKDGCLLLNESEENANYLVITGHEPGVVWHRSAAYYTDGSWGVFVERQDEFLSWIAKVIPEGF